MAALSSPSKALFADRLRPRTTLGAADRVVVRAIAEAMFSQDGEVAAARLDAHVAEVDALVSAASKPVRLGLRFALLVVLRFAPVLLFFKLARLETLSVDDRVAVLDRLERSKLAGLSLAFIGWRTVMTIVFYEHPTELRALGYSTNERTRYKRALPVVPANVPVPEESGVRLRGLEHEHEHEHEEDTDHGREVA